MPDALQQLALPIGAGIAAVVIVLWTWNRFRSSQRIRAHQRELRKRTDSVRAQRQALEQAAAGVIATSSTGSIAGYRIERQIEAVFTDGHPSPAAAVTALKAEAVRRGANALINLTSDRQPSGKCAARADAVVARPESGPAATPETEH